MASHHGTTIFEGDRFASVAEPRWDQPVTGWIATWHNQADLFASGAKRAETSPSEAVASQRCTTKLKRAVLTLLWKRNRTQRHMGPSTRRCVNASRLNISWRHAVFCKISKCALCLSRNQNVNVLKCNWTFLNGTANRINSPYAKINFLKSYEFLLSNNYILYFLEDRGRWDQNPEKRCSLYQNFLQNVVATLTVWNGR